MRETFSEYLARTRAEEDELKHYGVKGMKWGVRRDRDEKRHTVELNAIDSRTGKPSRVYATGATERAAKKNAERHLNETSYLRRPTKREADQYRDTFAKGRTDTPNTFKNSPQNRRMTDAELRSKLNRLQMEKQYAELTREHTKGKNFAQQLMSDTGKRVARNVATKAADVALQMALEKMAGSAKGSNKAFFEAMAATGKGKGKAKGKA